MNSKRRLLQCLCSLGVLAAVSLARADLTITGDTSGSNLVAALLGSNSNGLSNVTATLAAQTGTNGGVSSGTFSLSPPIPSTYGLTTNGIVLSTGNVAAYGTGPNLSASNTTDFGVAATLAQDAMLTPLTGAAANYDVTELDLTFDVGPNVSNITMTVVFGSEEFQGTNAATGNDALGIFLNGANIALINGGLINVQNAGFAEVAGTELNGIIADANSNGTFVITAPVTSGSTSNTLVFILGDGGDGLVDSTAYIAGLTADGGTVTPGTGVDLVVTKTADANTVSAGSNLTYTITVSNAGTNTATAVQLEDILPAGVTFTSVVTTAGTCTQDAGVVTCDLGDVAPGPGTNITITIVTTANTSSTISNTVTVSAAEADDSTADNSATAIVNDDGGGNGGGEGVDLTGDWQSVSFKCKSNGKNQNNQSSKCKIKGRLVITNLGTEDAASSRVVVYLSDDPVLDASDVVVREFSTGKIKPGKPKRKNVSASCKGCSNLSVNYLIAVIDAEDSVDETNEANNEVVSEPLQ